MKKLDLYSIMPLDTEHIDEICADICEQVKTGVSNCALFMMKLVPEGNPVFDKATEFCEKYKLFKEKLDKKGIRNGVLVQATIGHGWRLSERNPYQNVVFLHNGEDDVNTVCPYDEGFLAYIEDSLKTIASYNPYHIMIDDDLRLIGKPSFGCACPLHMAKFNELAGTELSRENLFDIFEKKADGYEKLLDAYVEVQRESIVNVAKAIRRGIDAVNPKLPASFCCVGNNAEFAADVSNILAGEGNPSVVRINGANYSKGLNKEFTVPIYRVACQAAKLEGKVDKILAETDTCPQNRYSTSAMTLHAHFTASILEGAKGAKHWITRLLCYEPECGKEYRRVLAKWSRFYEELAELVPKLKWKGFKIPVFSDERYVYDGFFGGAREDYMDGSGWERCVLDKFGLPMYFSSKSGGIACLEENIVKHYSDEQIINVLSGDAFLTAGACEVLINRGFGEFIGASVKKYKGKKIPSAEMFVADGNISALQQKYMELQPEGDKTVEDSIVYHGVGVNERERLFAGVTVYENSLGGRICVFCGDPKVEHRLATAYAFLNYSRKQQFIRLAKATGEIPVYYTGDAEIYLKLAEMEDGRYFCSLINLGFDPLSEIPLSIDREVKRIEKLMPCGKFKKVKFKKSRGKYIVDSACNTLEPVILIIK